jgi:hypothetical protein
LQPESSFNACNVSLGGRSRWPSALLGLTAILGALDAVAHRFTIYADGISYIEIAEAFRKGLWHEAINSYWSPLYSWLIAAWSSSVGRVWTSELVSLHALNYVVFLGSLTTFTFFTRELSRCVSADLVRYFRIIAHLTLLWSSVSLYGPRLPMPDVLVAMIVYAAFGLLLRLRRTDSTRTAIALGIWLALGYLAKTAMLPVAAAFVFATGKVRRGLLVAAGVTALSAPWISALSLAKGRLTVGDSGTINYAWEVAGARRWVHWQGSASTGVAEHPTRLINSTPEIYEFSSPVPGMYPPWRDPSYWYAGLRPQFDWHKQSDAFRRNGVYLLVLLVCCPASIAAGLSFIRYRSSVVSARNLWFLAFPGLCAIAMYTLVFVESRYVAPFVVTLGLCAFVIASVALPSAFLRWLACTLAACSLLIFAGTRSIQNVIDLVREPERFAGDPHISLAREANAHGVRAGSRICYVGMATDAYWVRLSGSRIICEVPIIYDRIDDLTSTLRVNTRSIREFWRRTPQERRQLLYKMHNAGADAVAADMVPSWASTEGWIEMRTRAPERWSEGRPTFVYLFR